MSSTFGKNIKISIFGQSHSPAIGVVADSLPAGQAIDLEELARFMARRAPGSSSFSTPRTETDQFEVLSGIIDGKTCGAPLAFQIRNTNTRPGDYAALRDTPRPSHADYTAEIKYGGHQDPTGGGHFSGRLTAPMCLIGGVALQLLSAVGIRIRAHIEAVGCVRDRRFDPVYPEIDAVNDGTLPTLDTQAAENMAEEITKARMDCDSVGGIIECAIIGLPVGLGEPMCDGMENHLSQMLFSIPAVKGLEFGAGFEIASMRGSVANDPFAMKGGKITTVTNNNGGILGGISNGMPIIFRVAIKPTPSIAREQKSVSISQNEDAVLTVRGRHDPCIVPRAVPCIEAAAAIAVYDMYLDRKKEL